MSRTVHVLAHRLAPRRLVEQGIDQIGDSLVQRMNMNGFPTRGTLGGLALVGMGVIIAFLRSSRHRVKHRAGPPDEVPTQAQSVPVLAQSEMLAFAGEKPSRATAADSSTAIAARSETLSVAVRTSLSVSEGDPE